MTATSLPPPLREPGGALDAARLEAHVPGLYRSAMLLCQSRDEAEELVHDTCERVLRRPRALRGTDAQAYLRRALKNTWINRNRARRTTAVLATEEELERLVDHGADPDIAVEAHEACSAIRALAPRFREAIVAVDVGGLSYRQAAEALGVPEGTVMSRLSRARQRVAAAMTEIAT
jgi:RNA polymerase sigma-70 factor (ECF subfamily)